MSYKAAADVLPEELVARIQEYVDGEVIYIPRKAQTRRKWGDNTQTKQMLNERNHNIRWDFQNGMNLKTLAGKYFLAEKSIRRILKSK